MVLMELEAFKVFTTIIKGEKAYNTLRYRAAADGLREV
jgi:hypothetical protein